MIPGFVIAYRNKNNKIVLYFYPGYTDQFEKIYADIDMSKIDEHYTVNRNIDGSVKYTFSNEQIRYIACKLIENDTNNEHIENFKNL